MADAAQDANDDFVTVNDAPPASPAEASASVVDPEVPASPADETPHDPDVKVPAEVASVDPDDDVVEVLDSVANLTQTQHSGETVEQFNPDGSRRDINEIKADEAAAAQRLVDLRS